ncbi:hypothetical protein Q5P01_011273 [Channa striata]|uniref:S100/CaBP-9k-type calcium binding subdomain domain-containing protein n=1 Tax=Channa striata TaxID=64152 RepID=A0AA88MUH5_CHASR|nr:hypothetical protein Q5P01_011273 [Channa striata]
MSGLSEAVEMLKATFKKYAEKEGQKNTLTKGELAELLRQEFPEGFRYAPHPSNPPIPVLDTERIPGRSRVSSEAVGFFRSVSVS